MGENDDDYGKKSRIKSKSTKKSKQRTRFRPSALYINDLGVGFVLVCPVFMEREGRGSRVVIHVEEKKYCSELVNRVEP